MTLLQWDYYSRLFYFEDNVEVLLIQKAGAQAAVIPALQKKTYFMGDTLIGRSHLGPIQNAITYEALQDKTLGYLSNYIVQNYFAHPSW